MLGRHHTEDTKKRIAEGNRGKIVSEETREKMRLAANRGEKNHMWKGNNVGYDAVHNWVRKHMSQSELCEMCKKAPSYDLANVTGSYTRDFSNWQYLCRKCHMESDGRINNNLKPIEKGMTLSEETKRRMGISKIGNINRRGIYYDMSERKCSICGGTKVTIVKGRPHWKYIKEQLVCSSCYRNHWKQHRI